VTLMLVLSVGPYLVGEWSERGFLGVAVWVAVSFGAMGLFFSLIAWVQRRGDFGSIGRARAAQGLATSAIQVGAGVAGFGSIGLVAGYVGGYLVGSLNLVHRTAREDAACFRAGTSFKLIRHMAAKYAHFPRYTVPAVLLNTASQQIPHILLPVFFAFGALGQFVLAYRVIVMPLSVVSEAVMKVFHREAVERHVSKQDLTPLVRSSYNRLLLVSAAPAALLFVTAPAIFGFVFGDEWREAGLYCQILLPALVARFVVTPSTCIFAVMERQREQYGLEGVAVVLRFSAVFAAAALFESPLWAISAYSVTGLAITGMYVVRIMSIAKDQSTDSRHGESLRLSVVDQMRG
jgi:O-antigen/teichoic acid export membrane protein